MYEPCFIAIDFDGTVTDADIIDAVLERFARPEWRKVEVLWERGIIGSRECLRRQMTMIGRPLDEILAYIDRFRIDETFRDFVSFLEARNAPFAIVSDGFQVFIERVLAEAGLTQVPVISNRLWERDGKLATAFPYAEPACTSANCKCMAVSDLSKDRALILVGDGRSDYCLARRANHVFTKKDLTLYCRENDIPHTPFVTFAEITAALKQNHLAPRQHRSVGAGKDRS